MKDGDEAGLSCIYVKYYHRLFCYGVSYFKDKFAVECIVQEAFLRLWNCRELIEEPKHIINFLRLVVKRECYSYATAPRNKFYRKMSYLSEYENYEDYLYGFDPNETEQEETLSRIQEELLRQVEEVLPFLSPSRQKMLRLCLEHGFRYKRIAAMLGVSMLTVCKGVQQAIADIQSILIKSKKLNPTVSEKPSKKLNFSGGLTAGQAEVLRLRYEEKMGFEKIAQTMDLPQVQVQKQFVVAYRIFSNLHNRALKPA